MKQNTRIARLVRNKRVKKLANFATVAMLVCPLAIGAVKALAENVEEPLATEEVISVEIGKNQEETPEIANSVLEVVPETKKVESEPIAPYIINEGSIGDYDLGNFQLQFFPVQERMFALEDKGVDVSSAVVIQQKIHKYLIDFGDHPSGDWNQLMAWLNEFDAEVTRLENENTGERPSSSLEDLGIDATELRSLMDQIKYALANTGSYTEESYALFLAGGDGTPQQNLVYAQGTLDKTDWLSAAIAQQNVDILVEELSYCLNLLVLAETPEPEVKVNITINYVSPENGTINTLTQEAIEGKPFTATAPDTFTQSTGPKFYRTSDASQTIASASEGAVITFNYEKIMATMNDVIVDGPSTAKVGDTVNYRMESTTYFNFGDPRIDYLEFEAGHPVTISDPSAAEITAGSVKFLKAGTYTLAGAAVSEPFTVTVTDKDVTLPVKPTIISKEWIVTGTTSIKAGGVLEFGVTEKVTYSDGKVTTKAITLPTGYVFTSTDPADAISCNKVTFGKNEGKRTISLVTKARTGETIVGLEVTVTKDGKPVYPTSPTKPVQPESGSKVAGGSNNQNNTTSLNTTGKNQNGSNITSKQESSKNLPTTGEKETLTMFLSGLVALGGMLVVVFKRRNKEVQ
ncbi:hypothetical protein ATZ33_07965 [Enterococcus silesiacus]|uniref:LPXTG-domain-containing protein cell wall anchor domain n=1 Tax=Enterococcus silesiacus TaxID=332949 RepID=A0A0S3KAM6_9ENTE|nr:LPXTG cell wall anchor domain-containing protein [Enterococcus silesiacus]ALS01304.1 hypothetical protein ATZ33_07965 [Enterococcus silesiacus]OJG90699.1 LPXTG-domain-containing protein cell wall anchor domain [Enterococcus silesiacus]